MQSEKQHAKNVCKAWRPRLVEQSLGLLYQNGNITNITQTRNWRQALDSG